MQQFYEKTRHLRLAVFDVDGVLTDGSLYLGDSGEELKAFHTLDGHGMKTLNAAGVELAIISGRSARCVELRAGSLGIRLLFQGVGDKLGVFERLLAETRIDAGAACYMGDDTVDLPVMRRCGLAFAVPAAPLQVRQQAHYVTRLAGGRGAVREVCDLLLLARSLSGAPPRARLR